MSWPVGTKLIIIRCPWREGAVGAEVEATQPQNLPRVDTWRSGGDKIPEGWTIIWASRKGRNGYYPVNWLVPVDEDPDAQEIEEKEELEA